MTTPKDARVPCTAETRDLLKAQKRGGESYDELLQKLVEQYDPEKAVTGTFTEEIHT